MYPGAGNNTPSIDQTNIAAASTNPDSDSGIIHNFDASKDIVKMNGSDFPFACNNIHTAVVAYDDIKYIDWVNVEEVNSDGSIVAALI